MSEGRTLTNEELARILTDKMVKFADAEDCEENRTYMRSVITTDMREQGIEIGLEHLEAAIDMVFGVFDARRKSECLDYARETCDKGKLN